MKHLLTVLIFVHATASAPRAHFLSDSCVSSLLQLWNFDRIRRISHSQPGGKPVETDPYSWKDCGGDPDLLKLDVELGPDPIPSPGTANATVKGDIYVNISHSYSLHAKVEYKLEDFWWIEVPCYFYCDFDDICDIFELVPECDFRCPIEPGSVSLDFTELHVPYLDVAGGEYRLTARLQEGQDLKRCYQATLNLDVDQSCREN